MSEQEAEYGEYVSPFTGQVIRYRNEPAPERAPEPPPPPPDPAADAYRTLFGDDSATIAPEVGENMWGRYPKSEDT